MEKEIVIAHDGIDLKGHISVQPHTRSWVIFAHGSGSSYKSPRNNWVASCLNQKGHSTLLFDLLTPEEDSYYENRFNISLLSERLIWATNWLLRSPHYRGEPFSYFGASTGAAAALMAASQQGDNSNLFTVISRGGRPDLAGSESLKEVFVPVLLIVGNLDEEVIPLNKQAQEYLPISQLRLIDGATHLFEESGKLSMVLELSIEWLETQIDRWSNQLIDQFLN